MCGAGKLADWRGNVWSGTFQDGKLHGPEGEYCSADGLRYNGDWKSVWDGRGTLIGTDGSRYIGMFRNGNREGTGSWSLASTDGSPDARYDGEWKDDVKCGQGAEIYSTNCRYHGTFKDDMRDGEGVMEWSSSGFRYTGCWRRGEMHGEGILENEALGSILWGRLRMAQSTVLKTSSRGWDRL